MQGSKVHEVKMEECKLHAERSMLGLVLKLAGEYGFQDLTVTQLKKVPLFLQNHGSF